MAKKIEYTASMIRAVKVLNSDLQDEAKKQGLKQNDIVLVKVGEYHSESKYTLQKIDGSIIEFMKKSGISTKG